MDELPKVKKRAWYDRDWLIELGAGVPAVIAAALASIGGYQKPETYWIGRLSLAVAAWVVCFGGLRVLRGMANDKKRDAQDSPNDLCAGLHSLHGALRELHDIPADDKRRVRITIHRVVFDEEPPREFEQVVPYVGGRGGDPGRKFSLKSGIIGSVYKCGEPMTFAWEDHIDSEDFIKALVDEYNYTVPEAEELISFRRSWMGVPLKNAAQRTIGVVFLDSSDEAFFDDTTQGIVAAACEGLGVYLQERKG